MKREALRMVCIIGGVWGILAIVLNSIGITLTLSVLVGLFGIAILVYGLRGANAWYERDRFLNWRTSPSELRLLSSLVIVGLASAIVLVSPVDWVTVLAMIALFVFGLYLVTRSFHLQQVHPQGPYVLAGRVYPARIPFWRPFFGSAEPFGGALYVSAMTKTWYAFGAYPVDADALPLDGQPIDLMEQRARISMQSILIHHKHADSDTLRRALSEKGFRCIELQHLTPQECVTA